MGIRIFISSIGISFVFCVGSRSCIVSGYGLGSVLLVRCVVIVWVVIVMVMIMGIIIVMMIIMIIFIGFVLLWFVLVR